MSPAKEALIKDLAVTWIKAKDFFDMIGMSNTYGLSPDERYRQSVAYELARTKVIEARTRLDAAQREIEQ